jgi:hypothetical protein
MKKLTTTIKGSPSSLEEAEMLQKVLAEVNACFMAFSLNCEVAVNENILDAIDISAVGGMESKEFTAKVADCNRTVAFITFIRNGVLADITFCKGKETVEAIAFMFDGDNGGMLCVP